MFTDSQGPAPEHSFFPHGRLLRCLTPEERAPHVEAIGKLFAEEFLKLASHLASKLPDGEALSECHREAVEACKPHIEGMVKDLVDETAAKVHRKRNPKPRNTAQDREIVRLVDEEEVAFKKVGRHLLAKNDGWGDQEGNPLSADAVRKAYDRQKQRDAQAERSAD